jgi:hypothetical protein
MWRKADLVDAAAAKNRNGFDRNYAANLNYRGVASR